MKALFARIMAHVTENKSGLVKWNSPPKTVFD